MKTGIYMIRNKVNDKKYIGQSKDIDKRWGEHISELNDNKHNNRYLQNSWNKYGADNFEFTIICLCEQDELDRLEIQYIAHFGTYNNGYNLTLGGDGVRGYRYTDEQRARRSEQNKEVMNRPEVKAKISERTKEALNRPEVRAKVSERTKEAVNRPEVKAKLSRAKKGKPKSEEWKAKVGETLKEVLNRPEVKAKMIKKVYCLTNDTVYAGVVEAGEKLNVPGGGGTVSWACQGKYGSGNGHVYKKLGLEFWFLDEYEEKFGKAVM